MKNFSLYFLISICFCVASCHSQVSNKDHQEAEIKRLNMNAMKMLERNILNKIPQDSFNLSLTYLDSALAIDSLSLLTYSNKTTILMRAVRLDDALVCLNKINNLNAENCTATNQLMGFIYLQKGDSISSKKEFSRAYSCLENLLKDKPKLALSIRSNMAFLKLLIENKEVALTDINGVISDSKGKPEIRQVLDMKLAIENFNQESYLNDMFPQ